MMEKKKWAFHIEMKDGSTEKQLKALCEKAIELDLVIFDIWSVGCGDEKMWIKLSKKAGDNSFEKEKAPILRSMPGFESGKWQKVEAETLIGLLPETSV